MDEPYAAQPPPLPPSPYPDDLIASCKAAFVSDRVRSPRATFEIHSTHVRIESPAVQSVSAYARRMDLHDLVLAHGDIDAIQPVGTMTALVLLPQNAAFAVAGPSVPEVLAAAPDALRVRARRFRPFFVGFWLINNRNSRIVDSRPAP